MTTTHSVATAAEQLIASASLHVRTLNIPDALRLCATDALTRIVAERHLEVVGFDPWVAALTPHDPTEAGEWMRRSATAGVDLTLLYGKNHAAILGVLRACVEADADMVRAVGYQLPADSDDLYAHAFTLAATLNVDRMLADTCSDVHFAAHKDSRLIATPARVQAHLRGVRGFELAACYYILDGAGAGPEQDGMKDYLGPVLKTFFPQGRLA